jgi:hypothetical protein
LMQMESQSVDLPQGNSPSSVIHCEHWPSRTRCFVDTVSHFSGGSQMTYSHSNNTLPLDELGGRSGMDGRTFCGCLQCVNLIPVYIVQVTLKQAGKNLRHNITTSLGCGLGTMFLPNDGSITRYPFAKPTDETMLNAKSRNSGCVTHS